MIRIIRTRTLEALAEDAARVPVLSAEAERFRRETEKAREDAEAARRSAQDAEARLEALTEEAGRRLGSLIKAARDPVTGPDFQAQIALQVVRDIIAEAKASGDPDAVNGVRVMDAVLGEDWPPPEQTRTVLAARDRSDAPLFPDPAPARSVTYHGSAAGRSPSPQCPGGTDEH